MSPPRRPLRATLAALALLACRAERAPRTAAPSTQPRTADPMVHPPLSPPAAAPRVWRVDRPRVLGLRDDTAFGWADGNVLVETSLATGEVARRAPLVDAPYIGEPSAWWPFDGFALGHFDGITRMNTAAHGHVPAWRDDAPWSTSVPLPDGLLLSSAQAVARIAATDGRTRWTVSLPRGAQPPELHVGATSVVGAWQQYAADAPTPRLEVPHRVAAYDLATGSPRWTRDFREDLGALAAWDDLLVVARGADVVFLDGPTGAVRRTHPRLGPPNIYPAVALDASRVLVALDGAVHAFDHAGNLLWRTAVEGVEGGSRLALAPDAAYVSTAEAAVVRLERDGRVAWRIGTGVAPTRLYTTARAVVVDGHGTLAGIPLPARVATEAVTVVGEVALGRCPASEVTVRAGGRSVPVAPDGSFRASFEAAGYVTASASRPMVEAERLPCPGASTVIALDGRGTYRVRLQLCGCG